MRLTGPRVTHVDAAGDVLQVERVQRLAEFQHHIIGHVDDRADAAQAAALEALSHPVRRSRARIHPAQDATAIQWARLLRASTQSRSGARQLLFGFGGDRLERAARNRRDLARHAEYAQAVAPVRRRLDRES